MKSRERRKASYEGLLAIGDPHLEGRQPGFRCDDYPNVILDKLRWCFDYAAKHRLLPILLGDLFDKPRDNPTWLVGQLIEMMLSTEIIGIYGNHDCAEPTLTENDSLSILIKSGCLQIVGKRRPWVGEMNGRQVVVGGSSYREGIPDSVPVPSRKSLFEEDPLILWITHHDITMAGYEGPGRFSPFEIENVDLLINGHIHRSLDTVVKGKTRWVTPGNISRRSRSDITRQHAPSVLRIDVQSYDYMMTTVPVPCQPAEQVFHEAVVTQPGHEHSSRFVDGLRELQLRRTDSGAGLHQFLDLNLTQFDESVEKQIRELANHVTSREEFDGRDNRQPANN